VLVYVELGGDDVLAGQLFSHRRRGSESASDVATVCSSWRVTARRNGLAGAQLDAMAPAFEHDQADQARRVIHGDTDAP